MQKVFREVKHQIFFSKAKGINFPAHVHQDIELVLTLKGGGTAFCDGKKYELKDNSFFLVFPNQVHHYQECSEGEYILLIVKSSVLLSFNNLFFGSVPISALWEFKEKEDDNTVLLMKTAVEEFARDGYSEIIGAYLTALFGKLLKVYNTQKYRETSGTALKILNYCLEHYKENITVKSVAKNLHISRSSVSHIFSTRLSMNFCDYINSLRLADAVRMLKKGNLPITEIAYTCGFSTIRTFNRAFLKQYGVSPTEYKKTR